MPDENMSQEFRLKKIDEIRNYLIEEINQNELIRSIKKFVLFWIITVTVCASISDFAPLAGIPIGITSSAIGLNICVTTGGIKKYKSINNIISKI